MAFDRSKFLARFIEETREHIDKINEGLLCLEKNPGDPETMNGIFRSAHTIKGSSRMMKLASIAEMAHKLEDTLDALKGNKIQLSKEVSSLLFRTIDIIADMIDKTAAGNENPVVDKEICEALEKVAKGECQDTSQPADSKSSDSREAQPSSDELLPAAEKSTEKTTESKGYETIRINAEKLDGLINLIGELVSNHSRLKQRYFDIKKVEKLAWENVKLFSNIENRDFGADGDTITNRVQSFYLKLKQITLSFKDDLSSQESLAGELQENALQTRMLPLSIVFNSLHRAARDIARSFSKDVELIIEGENTELDKKVIEKIGAPFMHMIRNSIDHGIENPAERLEAGKSERGVIKLSASYEGGSVLIKLGDDGRGISLEKIKENILQKKIINEDALNKMSESEIIDLIFYPGFSTSPIITDISGRGVGMDVVKKNIVQDLKGTIRIATKEGKGTIFYIRLPLTLAIMRVLLITVSDTTYAIPSNYINEILKIPQTEVINVLDKKAVRLREEIIPIANLAELLNLPNKGYKNELLIILVNLGGEKLGFVVDSLLEEEDIVIKPLPSHMQNNKWVSGVIIMGNNMIVNVLNVSTIRDAAKEMKDLERFKKMAKPEKKDTNILVVDDSINTREIEKSILEAYGYKVNLASDGMDALEKAKEFAYDLIITDVEMPRMDGFSLTEKLRAHDVYKHTPVIILTSKEKEEDKRRGIQVGANAYIVKGSFDQSNLLDTVQSLVD